MPFDELDSKDFKPITTIFTRGNWNDFYDCYKQYVCDKCNRFDWLKATQNGILATPKLPVRMPDFFLTSDFRSFVVSASTKKAFETFSGEIAEFFPIPQIKDYYVLLPKRLLFRPDKVVISEDYKSGEPFRSEDPVCKKCKKYPDLCFRGSLYLVPDNTVFGGIVIDTKGMTLVASRELSDHLRKAKLTGMAIEKNAFANPSARK
jgi:hypothetical protein